MKKLNKRKKGERDMFLAKLHAAKLPPPSAPYETYSQFVEREMREALSNPPPPGTVRKVESDKNEIIAWPTGFTIYGPGAWRLYQALLEVKFTEPPGPGFHRGRTITLKNMRHLLEYIEPCSDVRPLLDHALRVEAALMGAEVDWLHSTGEPVAIRKAD